MYSNDTTQIKAGMVNYVGALLGASKLPPRAARHDVCAMLIEEAVKLSQEEDKNYDMYILKPLLRSVKHVFNSHIAQIDNDMKGLPIEFKLEMEAKRANYSEIVKNVDEILSGF